jgi:hypothetical protein
MVTPVRPPILASARSLLTINLWWAGGGTAPGVAGGRVSFVFFPKLVPDCGRAEMENASR